MPLKITDQIIDHKNCFIIVAEGYYGDMDQNFREQSIISTLPRPLIKQTEEEAVSRAKSLACRTFKDLKLVKDGRFETVKDLLRETEPELVEDAPEWDRRHDELVHLTDDYEILPSIDDLTIRFYDENGICFNVEVS